MIFIKSKKFIIALIITGALVLAIMAVIFYFSSCDGDKSGAQSGVISDILVKIFEPDFDSKSPAEREEIIHKVSLFTRKTGHFTEFMLLGIAASLFILVLKGKLYIALIFSVLYAASDEIHQIFVDGRGPSVFDVLIDSLGVLFGIAIVCTILRIRRRKVTSDEKACCV